MSLLSDHFLISSTPIGLEQLCSRQKPIWRQQGCIWSFVLRKGPIGSTTCAFEALSCLIKIQARWKRFFHARCPDWQMSPDPLGGWVGFVFFCFVFFTELFNHNKCDWGLKHIIQKCSNAYEFLRSYPSYENVIRTANSWIFLPSLFFNVSGGSEAIFAFVCLWNDLFIRVGRYWLCLMRLKPWPRTKWMPWAGQWPKRGF